MTSRVASMCLLLAAPTAVWGQEVKPYILINVDTSTSMTCDICATLRSNRVDNSVECAGADVACATCNAQGCGNAILDDSRLNKVKIALGDVVGAFGEVTFGLSRFHQAPNAFQCDTQVSGTYCVFVTPSGGWSGAGTSAATDCKIFNPGEGFNAADVLVPFREDNQSQILQWLDGCDNWPTSTDCDAASNLGGSSCSPGQLCADCGTGCDRELRGTGLTPLAGSLVSMRDYIKDLQDPSTIPYDPAAECRPYVAILLTDGEETCNGDPAAEAARLCNDLGVPVYVVGFATTSASLNAIAAAGCDLGCNAQGCRETPIFVEDETQLALAMADIAQSAVLRELCNGLDDDCDGLTDEDFPGLGDDCCDPCPGTIVCNPTQDGTMCSGIGPPETNCPEICNGVDDDCDRIVDEGLFCPLEVCNGIDDDGDGQTDEPPLLETGRPCGKAEGVCEMGNTCCQNGRIQCCGETPPTQEICDCLDNNCNTQTDENVFRYCYTGPPSECPDPETGSCAGLCRPGTQACDPSTCPPTPTWGTCVGEVGPREEKCNCLDDDCDGVIDDGATCPGGVPCVNCTCVQNCDPAKEFPCPAGYVCSGSCDEEEPPPHFCVPNPCIGVLCELGFVCDECTGDCVSLCEQANCGVLECCGGDCCETWESCEDTDTGDVFCVDTSCTNLAFPCEDGKVCSGHECVDHPCTGVRCGENEFCREGECIKTCPACPAGEVCKDGQCVTDLCAEVVCPIANTVCCAGQCINDPCVADVQCEPGQFCDPCAATCQEDLCPVTNCPAGSRCLNNQCVSPREAGETLISVSGVGGCSCHIAAPPAASGAGWLVLLGIGAALLGATRRRRRLRSLGGLLLCATLCLAATGCDVRTLRFTENPDGGLPDMEPDLKPDCVPIAELCNGVDDDCDGFTDDGDPEGGGPCGVGCDGDECAPIGVCTLGTKTCLAGQLVCIGDVRPSAEECDGLDNSCDGETDEGFDFCNDINHCGGCTGTGLRGGRGTCDIPNAIPKCDFIGCGGTCEGCARCEIEFCKSGYVDCEGDDPPNDCDCECSVAPGPEVCDGIDNDCNGLIDDGVTSPNFCRQLGACGGATPICLAEQGWCCNYGPDVETYVPNPPVPCGFDVVAEEEICDDIDGDCDGGTDEIFIDKDDPCADSGIGACQGIGTYRCTPDGMGTECIITQPGLPPTHEICDGKDNDCDTVTDENTSGPSNCGGTCLGVRDSLVTIGNLRIYTYEASRPGSTSSRQGTPANRACSVPDVLPWSSVTWAQADEACANAGMRLCSASEWQRACEGASNRTWTYGNQFSDGADDDGDGLATDGDECNGNDYDTDSSVALDQDNSLPTGSLASCRSQEGVYDMSGNLQEWTDDPVGAGYRARGGAYDDTDPGKGDGSGGLECDNDFTVLPDDWIHPNTGFRCCCTVGVDCP